MSMIGNYKRLSPEKLNDLIAEPEGLMEFLYPDDETSSDMASHLDIDKTWQAIHFLLTGDAWKGTPPLSNAVLGGTELSDEDVGYGPARYLSASEVADVAKHLSKISQDELISRFDLNRFRESEIYPDGWVNSNEERDYITEYYLKLVSFFQDAARSGDALLLYIN